jgi:CubicO group peptidase (beta-lactamase class C family)
MFPTRRQFLQTGLVATAATAENLGGATRSLAQSRDNRVVVTGDTDRRLAPYDDLMATFMREHRPPGAALAVVRDARLVYARGFGYADVEKKEPVQPNSLFRIASVSKPFTSTACFQLVEKRKLSLNDKVFELLNYRPFVAPGAHVDPRIMQVTVRQCLQHTGGWDRDKSPDPMSSRSARIIAQALQTQLPIKPEQIIRYTMGKPLDFDPATAFAYSNFGYCVLGRVIESVSGESYGEFVTKNVLEPLGIRRMRLGKNLLRDRAAGEVRYYDSKKRTGPAISGPQIGQQAPLPYGVEAVESMDANGGWIASAIDLVRFAAALENPQRSKLLKPESFRAMLARPEGAPGREKDGRLQEAFYACGWNVRPVDAARGRFTKWHFGMLAGSSTLLVSRSDRISWAVLFNCDADAQGKEFAATIDPLLHGPADKIKNWPTHDLFKEIYRVP